MKNCGSFGKSSCHMAAHVEEAIALAVRSLKERKGDLAREVLRNEDAHQPL